MYTITYIFRHPSPRFNSIENVFNAIFPYIEKERTILKENVPKHETSILNLIRNCFFIRKKVIDGICHITGHNTYLGLVSGKNTILTIHDIGSAFNGSKLRDYIIANLWFRCPFSKVKIITVISQFSANEIIRRFPKAEKKIRVIHNPVDDRFQYNSKKFNECEPLILCVGTKKNKNLERTIKAITGLRCRLAILGILSKEQKQLLDSNYISYTEYSKLSLNEVTELYKLCDLLVFASTYEGFGMPILEAQATGRPVITSNIGAMAEIAGGSAELTDPYAVSSIRNGILKVINDKALRERLLVKGLENVEKYRAAKIAEKYLELYNSFPYEN
jgi:glycosyltransferase involved in cell wall biosynthesis